MSIDITSALDLVSKLSRCRNFPQSDQAVEDFARALMRAGEMLNVDAAEIIQRCADLSEFCPTDADLLNVARDLKDEQRRREEAARPSQTEEWRKIYGPPKPFDTSTANPEWYAGAKTAIKRREELWEKLKVRFAGCGARRGRDWPDWGVLAKAARDLGYPEYAAAWERAVKW